MHVEVGSHKSWLPFASSFRSRVASVSKKESQGVV